MSGDFDPAGDEDLFQQARWVQGLAFAILRDRQLAEDVSQEVLLRALAGEPRQGRVLKAWLAAVTRNLSFNAQRDRKRQSAREERAARPEAAPPAKTPLEVLEAHRALTAAIAALAPDQREVVVLRFFEDLDFADIAARLGVREDAARMRLHRALIALRGELSARDRDWKALCTLALPSTLRVQAVAVGGILLMNTTILKIAGVAVGLLLILLLLPDRAASDLDSAEPVLDAAITAYDTAAGQQLMRETVADHGLEDTEMDADAAWVTPEPVTGRVRFQGVNVEGAQVEVRQGSQLVNLTTDRNGLFELELDPTVLAVVRTFSELGSACREVRRWPARIDLEPLPGHPNRVLVRDTVRDRPVPDVRVRVLRSFSEDWRPATENEVLVADGVTNRDGVLEFGQEPGFYFFDVSAPGYHSYYGDVGRDGGGEWYLELSPGQDPELFILDDKGNPLEGCEVILGTTAYRKVRVEASGLVPGPLGWNGPPEDSGLPFSLIVRLLNGRLWVADTNSANPSAIRSFPGRVECWISDPAIEVTLQSGAIPQGCWVEAARMQPGRYETELLERTRTDPDVLGTATFLNFPWARLAAGESVPLERGWTGTDTAVCARIQPGNVWLGTFPVEDGKATVRVPILARLQLQVSDLPVLPGPGAWKLTGFGNYQLPGFGRKAGVGSVTDPVSRTGRFEHWVQPGQYKLVLTHTHWGLELHWDGHVFRDGTERHLWEQSITLPEGDTVLQAAAEFESVSLVQIRVEGHPVEGGVLGNARIDPHGMMVLRREPDGRARYGNPIGFELPSALGLQPELPIYAINFAPDGSSVALPFDGTEVVDFRLAAFLVDSKGLELSKHRYDLVVMPLQEGQSAQSQPSSRIHQPYSDSRKTTVRDLRIDATTVSWVFRIPEGRYMVWLRWIEERDGKKVLEYCDLTPLNGRHFSAGTQTVLSRQD